MVFVSSFVSYQEKKYQPISSEKEEREENEKEYRERRATKYPSSWWYRALPVLLGLWTVTLILASGLLHRSMSRYYQNVYSPLREHVEHERVRFNNGLWGETTVYMGTPTNESDAAWDNLSRHGIIKLTPEQADKMSDPTAVYSDDDDGSYIAGTAMWHQFHCLSMIRHAVWNTPAMVNWTDEHEKEHTDHCLDYLRQIIQCHGDVDLIPFEHVVEKQVYRPTFNYTRTCVRYEPLEKWVDEHRAGNNTPDGQV